MSVTHEVIFRVGRARASEKPPAAPRLQTDALTESGSSSSSAASRGLSFPEPPIATNNYLPIEVSTHVPSLLNLISRQNDVNKAGSWWLRWELKGKEKKRKNNNKRKIGVC